MYAGSIPASASTFAVTWRPPAGATPARGRAVNGGKSYDVIVVGAGTAGCVVAARPRTLAIPVAHDLPGVGENLQDHPLASDEALDRWLRGSVTAAHASGTCRMGPADAGAVVDPRCRVHGIGRLWLADASVMPRIVRANTAATATMIAERVAAWVGAA